MPTRKPRKKRRRPAKEWNGFGEEWKKLQQRRIALRAEWDLLEEESRKLRKLMKEAAERARNLLDD